MKLALKYGLIIAAGAMLWVLIAHQLFPDPMSPVHSLGAFTFFNLLHFVLLFLGIRAFEREQGDKPTFKEGLKTGISISFVYAVAISSFFVVLLLVIGPKWMANDPTALQIAPWLLALRSFSGLVLFTMFLGLVYSTVISFALAKRRSSEA
jgi:hypothetical protein